MCKWEKADVLVWGMHPSVVKNNFWKLIDTSKQSSDADSPPGIPVVVGNGGCAKAQARNTVFCNICPS